MTKIKAVDYKGKWFTLQDELYEEGFDFERKEIDVDLVIEKSLKEHVKNCIYYGIPAYIGKDEKLKARIKELEDVYLANPRE